MTDNDPNHRRTSQIDWQRAERTEVPEVMYAEFKSASQVADILQQHIDRDVSLLITRLQIQKFSELPTLLQTTLDYDRESQTAICWQSGIGHSSPHSHASADAVGILCAGTSDWPIAREVERTLEFLGIPSALYTDVGVAGLWRLVDIIGELDNAPVIVAIAGMEGALFSVVGGLVPCPVIAVPTSVGYGVSEKGQVALNSALASCAPGVVTVNIDNGFGAAAAAAKMLAVRQRPRPGKFD